MLYFIKIVFSILIPVAISGFNSSINKENIKRCIKNLLITCISSNTVMIIFYMLFRDVFTVYEFLYINSFVAIFCEFFVIPILNKKKISDVILKTVCLEAIFLALYSILTYGQICIHSDTATATILSESIVRHKNLFPASWVYANGDVWVISNGLFTLLPSILMENQSLARMVGSSILVIITLITMIYQSKRLFKNKSWFLSVPIFTVFLLSGAEMILYQAAYTGQMMWIAICPTLMFLILEYESIKKSIKPLIINSIILILLMMSGIRFAAEQVVPLWLACAIYLFFKSQKDSIVDWKLFIKKLVYFSVVVFIPSGIGYAIYKWLCTWHNVNNNVNSSIVFVNSISDVWNNLIQTILAFYDNFGFCGNTQLISVNGIRNFISIIMCTIVCFIVPSLQLKKIKNETKSVQFFYIYGIIHNLIMVVLAILFGKTETRYLLSSVFVFIIISSRYIYEYWILQKNYKKNMWIGLFVFATIIECVGLGLNSVDWDKKLNEKKEFNQILIDYDLTKGYSSYWNAYTNEVYSDLKIKYGGVAIYDSAVKPFLWLVDSEVYIPEDKHTFLLLSEDENNLISSNIDSIFSKPIDKLEIDDKYIYIFDYDIAADFPNGLDDNILKPAEVNCNEYAKKSKDKIVLYTNGVQFGPFSYLDRGDYIVTYKGDNLDFAMYDVFSNMNCELISYKEISRNNDTIVIQLSLAENI